MPKELNEEDAMLKEHDEFMQQVNESGVPSCFLRYYGYPPLNPKPNVDNSKINPGIADKYSPDTPI